MLFMRPDTFVYSIFLSTLSYLIGHGLSGSSRTG